MLIFWQPLQTKAKLVDLMLQISIHGINTIKYYMKPTCKRVKAATNEKAPPHPFVCADSLQMDGTTSCWILHNAFVHSPSSK